MNVAMRALDATVETMDAQGQTRSIAMGEFHRLPGDTPQVETDLRKGEIITAVTLPKPIQGTHIYRKVRDRASYAFATVSIAAVIASEGGGSPPPGSPSAGWRTSPGGSLPPRKPWSAPARPTPPQTRC